VHLMFDGINSKLAVTNDSLVTVTFYVKMSISRKYDAKNNKTQEQAVLHGVRSLSRCP